MSIEVFEIQEIENIKKHWFSYGFSMIFESWKRQNPSKIASETLQDAPRDAQDAIRTLQDAPRDTQDALRDAQDAPRSILSNFIRFYRSERTPQLI